MTAFEVMQQEAKMQAQAAMKPYGLEIDMRHSSWHYDDRACTRGTMTTYTKHYPAKGNKAMIEQLRAAGFRVWIVSDHYNQKEKRRMVFWAEIDTPLTTEEAKHETPA